MALAEVRGLDDAGAMGWGVPLPLRLNLWLQQLQPQALPPRLGTIFCDLFWQQMGPRHLPVLRPSVLSEKPEKNAQVRNRRLLIGFKAMRGNSGAWLTFGLFRIRLPRRSRLPSRPLRGVVSGFESIIMAPVMWCCRLAFSTDGSSSWRVAEVRNESMESTQLPRACQTLANR